jgi:hypothetical protein
MLRPLMGSLMILRKGDTKDAEEPLACPHASLSTGTLWLSRENYRNDVETYFLETRRHLKATVVSDMIGR